MQLTTTERLEVWIILRLVRLTRGALRSLAARVGEDGRTYMSAAGIDVTSLRFTAGREPTM